MKARLVETVRGALHAARGFLRGFVGFEARPTGNGVASAAEVRRSLAERHTKRPRCC